MVDCETMLQESSQKDKLFLESSVMLDGEKFSYLQPNQFSQEKIGVSDYELQVTLSVLGQYRKKAESEMLRIKSQIEELEKIVEKPYVKNKERPYQLHAIMIHDGLAMNGHYYTYLFDRIKKVWWQLNDHKATIVEEAQVMSEALGGQDNSYKSACNLFYISKKVADQIDECQAPLYSRDSVSIKKE